ncbi:MAG: hypothetical protein JNM07_13875 [Phycisphaerae bacterium]|nr:hypothetical protein [Phycisphaerae bacterium]
MDERVNRAQRLDSCSSPIDTMSCIPAAPYSTRWHECAWQPVSSVPSPSGRSKLW